MDNNSQCKDPSNEEHPLLRVAAAVFMGRPEAPRLGRLCYKALGIVLELDAHSSCSAIRLLQGFVCFTYEDPDLHSGASWSGVEAEEQLHSTLSS